MLKLRAAPLIPVFWVGICFHRSDCSWVNTVYYTVVLSRRGLNAQFPEKVPEHKPTNDSNLTNPDL